MALKLQLRCYLNHPKSRLQGISSRGVRCAALDGLFIIGIWFYLNWEILEDFQHLIERKMAWQRSADFGLSGAFTNESYVDPEAQASGNFNKKSDVYSFGIILLELITGQPAITRQTDGGFICIHQWIRPIIDRGDILTIVDPRLDGEFDATSAWKAVETAFSCVSNASTQRPDMSHVLAELQECLATVMAVEESQTMKASVIRSSNSLPISHLNIDTDLAPSPR
ncbi:probable LRR receptor-like serine/threonine-protein kinase At1g07560 [Hevea brasiliensis]|uniref:probable LRR receptor-like serine/threonine-protein kinase At1g07560 n=1 Tax=Hevea brasiliensis TaxID=3981 RepID=UPI0025D37B32|nr:probable LRR receptor-like serine/threonine-protein kinase At1g07560 [Hevea brasiliensis]